MEWGVPLAGRRGLKFGMGVETQAKHTRLHLAGYFGKIAKIARGVPKKFGKTCADFCPQFFPLQNKNSRIKDVRRERGWFLIPLQLGPPIAWAGLR